MKQLRRSVLFLLLCALFLWFLADAETVRADALRALKLCGTSVIPAMFPFLVVTRLLLSLGFGAWVSPLLSGWMTPLFHLPGAAGSAVVLGLVGGYPMGAVSAAQLYRQGQLTQDEAERLLTFCNNSNPVFLISVLGAGVFGSVRAGVWLWLVHLLAALLTGILLRGKGAPRTRRPPPSLSAGQHVSFSAALVGAVRGAAEGMLSVCAFVVLFYVLAAPLRQSGGRFAPLLVGALELFSVTPLLTADRFGFVLAAAVSGWGGLSVLCQSAAALEETNLRLRPCLTGKLLHALLSAALAFALSPYVLA